jgi:hypothetical protein
MKKPPRYGSELSEMTRKLFHYALMVHLLFAFFMFSNTYIFTTPETFTQTDKTFFKSLFHDNTRLSASHSKIYLAFLILFYILFILYKIAEYLYETID